MTPEQTREAIKVMQHYADGGKVECRWRDGDGTRNWRPIDAPMWNWEDCEYRTVREPLRTWAVVRRDRSVAAAFPTFSGAVAHCAYLNTDQPGIPYRVVEMVEVME